MIYGALWRVLAGPPVLKALQALVLLAAVVAVLFLWVFPRIAPAMPFNDNTVGAASTVGSLVATAGGSA
jgi:hypothetical protein